MMGTELVPETCILNHLMQLEARESFIASEFLSALSKYECGSLVTKNTWQDITADDLF
jgi:hypothetical protein